MTFNPEQPPQNPPMTRRQLRELERLREEQQAEQERLRQAEQPDVANQQYSIDNVVEIPDVVEPTPIDDVFGTEPPQSVSTEAPSRREPSYLPEGVELTSEVTDSPLGGSIFSSTQRPYMPKQFSDYLSDPPKLVTPPPPTPEPSEADAEEPVYELPDEVEESGELASGGRRSSYLPAEDTLDQAKLDSLDSGFTRGSVPAAPVAEPFQPAEPTESAEPAEPTEPVVTDEPVFDAADEIAEPVDILEPEVVAIVDAEPVDVQPVDAETLLPPFDEDDDEDDEDPLAQFMPIQWDDEDEDEPVAPAVAAPVALAPVVEEPTVAKPAVPEPTAEVVEELPPSEEDQVEAAPVEGAPTVESSTDETPADAVAAVESVAWEESDDAAQAVRAELPTESLAVVDQPEPLSRRERRLLDEEDSTEEGVEDDAVAVSEIEAVDAEAVADENLETETVERGLDDPDLVEPEIVAPLSRAELRRRAAEAAANASVLSSDLPEAEPAEVPAEDAEFTAEASESIFPEVTETTVDPDDPFSFVADTPIDLFSTGEPVRGVEAVVEAEVVEPIEVQVEAEAEAEAEAAAEEPVDPVVVEAEPDPLALRDAELAARFGPKVEPTQHWTQELDSDVLSRSSDDDDEDFDSRLGTTSGGAEPRALIVPELHNSLTGPLNSTGEIILTGTIPMPKSFGETGSYMPLDTDDHDADTDHDQTFDSILDPMRASNSISALSSQNQVSMAPMKQKKVSTIVLGSLVGVSAVVAIGLLVWAGISFFL